MNIIDLIQSFDLYVLNAIHKAFSGSFSDVFWKIITWFGEDGLFWIGLSLLLLIPKKTRKWGGAMFLAICVGYVVGNVILKNAVGRIRPYDVNQLFPLTVEHLSDYSFPSGHTMAAMGAAIALLYENKKAGIPAVILGVLIMYSRLHLYVHYPSDVLGGAIVALFSSLAGFIMCELIAKFLIDLKNEKAGAKQAPAGE